ncbi:lactoylglutathione lyase [Chitinophaga skermanii]|uniref:Lactoylglutathione lyase n=1 Tax=Chitinophaga skermanii TaxID=331697 RepID=A0A327QMG2_9BACT|nr:VOC family protein [Chitinophaga skermanii]RAJ05451.1 lactoylglutathione lyase [Chitinophaga skermanii]
MHINHIAIWVDDLEKMKDFYLVHFNATASEKYVNPVKQFSSYFISFANGKGRIELMHNPHTPTTIGKRGYAKGWAHLAITVGDRRKVNEMTENFRQQGFTITGEPRVTGDGYYEAVFLDPEGNVVELVANN